MRRALLGAAAAALVAVLPACDVGLPAGRAPHREGNRLDMADQPKQKPLDMPWRRLSQTCQLESS